MAMGYEVAVPSASAALPLLFQLIQTFSQETVCQRLFADAPYLGQRAHASMQLLIDCQVVTPGAESKHELGLFVFAELGAVMLVPECADLLVTAGFGDGRFVSHSA